MQGVDENTSFIVIDFNVKNQSDRDFVVRDVTVTLSRPDGDVDGSPVAARDLVDAFHAYPALGERFNDPMKARDVFARTPGTGPHGGGTLRSAPGCLPACKTTR